MTHPNIDFEKILISERQLKMLKLLDYFENINNYQFHGYFKFPRFTDILIDIQDLEKLGLVSDVTSPLNGYIITTYGKKYLAFVKEKRRKRKIEIVTVLASLTLIFSFIINYLV